MREALRVKNLKKEGILKEISFELSPGEMVAVMGPSGSGKSTLLANVSGMDRASEGEVWLGEKQIQRMNEEERAQLRLRHMGFVFQQMNVISHLSLLENIVLPAVYANRKNKKEYYARARERMAEFGIGGLEDKHIWEVSGGQLQRACICRSILQDPKILFADEPTGALNRAAAREVMEAFQKIKEGGTTILLVTHDSKVASMCDRVLYLLDGEIKGEVSLGAYAPGDAKREEKLTRYLESMGW